MQYTHLESNMTVVADEEFNVEKEVKIKKDLPTVGLVKFREEDNDGLEVGDIPKFFSRDSEGICSSDDGKRGRLIER